MSIQVPAQVWTRGHRRPFRRNPVYGMNSSRSEPSSLLEAFRLARRLWCRLERHEVQIRPADSGIDHGWVGRAPVIGGYVGLSGNRAFDVALAALALTTRKARGSSCKVAPVGTAVVGTPGRGSAPSRVTTVRSARASHLLESSGCAAALRAEVIRTASVITLVDSAVVVAAIAFALAAAP